MTILGSPQGLLDRLEQIITRMRKAVRVDVVNVGIWAAELEDCRDALAGLPQLEQEIGRLQDQLHAYAKSYNEQAEKLDAALAGLPDDDGPKCFVRSAEAME